MKIQINKLLSVLVIFTIIIILSTNLIISAEEEKDIGVRVEGKSELIVPPDKSKINIGVSITKPTAIEAQENENKVISKIVEELVSSGIPKTDIQTESINLYEDKVWQDKEYKSLGWKATQILKVETKNFTMIGKIVDVSIENGANEIQNILFYLSKDKENEYKKKAIVEATKNGKEKAEIIADSLGKKLGKVKSVVEGGYNFIPYMYDMKNAAGAAAISESATIMPKDVTISSNIILTYEII